MTCDNCGKPVQDRDECLCRKCKPSLLRKYEIADAKEKISVAYWNFTRQARALPPSMAVPMAYVILKKYLDIDQMAITGVQNALRNTK